MVEYEKGFSRLETDCTKHTQQVITRVAESFLEALIIINLEFASNGLNATINVRKIICNNGNSNNIENNNSNKRVRVY